ncbi:MAG: electron transfer flavoprotein subunit alpha/FixB family protein [Bacteroidales bacterium]|nr:electron transfer flavoprotein subunit alpha/FixB family protein [Bacteroidales bacterium]
MSILIYTENRDGKFRKPIFELVSYASALAEIMNVPVTAVSVGEVPTDELHKLAGYGAGKIITVTDPAYKIFDTQSYTALLAEIAAATGANVLILANNTSGKALAPRLSVRLKAGIAPGVTGLPVSTNPFIVNRRVYSGNALARVAIKTPVRILTLMQNSFDLAEKKMNPVVEAFTPSSHATAKTEVIDIQKQDGKVLLTEASVVVSGGRGMKSPENWAPLEELASLLDGATACSRPVSDEGWRPHGEHTGQTGKIIAPDLYIAVGISGATQHLAGVSSSKYIVAVNSDKSAPIFEAAQYGIVGDAAKVLPKLVDAVKAAKGK